MGFAASIPWAIIEESETSPLRKQGFDSHCFRRGVALSLLSDVLPFAADFLRGTIVPLPGHFTGTSRKILSLLIR
jgi:hypothetical protein